MFYDKISIDKHVAEVTSTYTEYEKNLSSYYIARNYYHVGDYETAREYVLRYLKVQEASADAHKLLGRILDALDQKEAASAKAKYSLETDGKEDKFVNKSPSSGISGVSSHVRLLAHYIDNKKLEMGYKHAVDVEENYDFKDNLQWTETVCQLLEMCKIMHTFDWKFWILYSSCLERLTKFFLKKEVDKPLPRFLPVIGNDTMLLNGVTNVPAPKEAANIPVVVGEFSFTSNPIIQEKKSNDAAKTAQKSNETSKPSPFAGCSFTKPDSTSEGEQTKNANTRLPAATINAVGVQPAQQKTGVNNQKSLTEMFKPAAGSWGCGSYYTRNDGANAKPVGTIFGNVGSAASIPSTTATTLGSGFATKSTISFGAPATTTSWSNIFGGSSSSPATTSSSNTFGGSASTAASTGADVSFGANTPKTGGLLFGAQPAQPAPQAPTIQPILGSVSTTPNTSTIFRFGAATNGKSAESRTETKSFENSKTCSPGSLTSTTLPSAPNIPLPEISKADQELAEKSRALKGLSTPAFGVPTSTLTNPAVLESVNKAPSETKKEGGFSFLPPENAASSSTLAAEAPQQPALQTDPNVLFAGAGATVFGAKQAANALQSQAKTDSAVKNDENEGEEGEPDNREEHDPHFEPIVPLPDAIEVRTGEEDEEKVNKYAETAEVPEDGEHDDDKDDNENDNEEEDEDEQVIMFEKRVTLMVQENGDTTWKTVATGDLKVLYDPNICGARISLEADSTREILSNTVISMQTEMQVIENECLWSAKDDALEPPVKRNLKAVFLSLDVASDVAQEMFKFFKEGHGYATEFGIREAYDAPKEE